MLQAVTVGYDTVSAHKPVGWLQAEGSNIGCRESRELETLILYTAHEPHHGVLAEEVVLLQAGRVVARGESSKVLRAEVLEMVYGIDFYELDGIPLAEFFVRTALKKDGNIRYV